jgi:hypothetical protein
MGKVMKYFKCIFFDVWEHRHDQFKLVDEEEDWVVSVDKCISVEKLKEAMEMGIPANVIFISGMFSPSKEMGQEEEERNKFIDYFASLPLNRQPGLIVYHGMVDNYDMITILEAYGYTVYHDKFVDRQWKNIERKATTERQEEQERLRYADMLMGEEEYADY